jgi:uncharacterized membrane protein
MSTRARVMFAGHALHTMVVFFPLGLLGVSPLWDILRLSTTQPMWGAIAFWTIALGVGAALLAAVPGLLDYGAIPSGTRAKLAARRHMQLNFGVVAAFALSLILRKVAPSGYVNAGLPAMVPGWIGMVMAMFSGWLGGELVQNHGVAVHEGASLDAPSSLDDGRTGTTRPVYQR